MPEKTLEARSVNDGVYRQHLNFVWALPLYYSENEVTEFLLDTN